jgi:hypothetical protein
LLEARTVFGRSIGSTLGFFGGLLVVLGGIVTFLLHLAGGNATPSWGGLLPSIAELAIALIFGALIVFTCGPRMFWSGGSRLFTGILLILFGVLTWILLSGSILIELGALLTIVGGIILPLQGWLGRGFGRRWYY